MLPLRTCEGVALPDETTRSTELSHALILPEHIDEMQKCHADHIYEMQKYHVAVLECQPARAELQHALPVDTRDASAACARSSRQRHSG